MTSTGCIDGCCAATRRVPPRVSGGNAAALSRPLAAEPRLALWIDLVADLFRTAPKEHLDMIWNDLLYAFRALRKTPVVTAAVVATLALALGANTAIFSVVQS
jgi:hypothetical protein